MLAIRKRKDEDFIVPDRATRRGDVVRLADDEGGQGGESPARVLQAQLDKRIGVQAGAAIRESKFNGPTTLLIIVGSSVAIWASIIAAVLAIF